MFISRPDLNYWKIVLFCTIVSFLFLSIFIVIVLCYYLISFDFIAFKWLEMTQGPVGSYGTAEH